MADCLCAYISIPILKHSHSPQNPFLLLQNRSFASPRTSKIWRKCSVLLCRSSTAESTSTIHSSSEFDIVGIHEHHDGSLIFKFGDPSEAAVLEESNSGVNEIEWKVESLNVGSQSLDTVNSNSAALHSVVVGSESLNSSATSLSSGIENSGVMSSQKVRGFFEGTIEFREKSSEESRDVNNVESFKLNIVIHGIVESVVPPTESEPVIDAEAASVLVDKSVEEDSPSQLPEPALDEFVGEGKSTQPILDEKAGSKEEDSSSCSRLPEPVLGKNDSATVIDEFVEEDTSLDEETDSSEEDESDEDDSSSQSSEPVINEEASLTAEDDSVGEDSFARPSLDEEAGSIAVENSVQEDNSSRLSKPVLDEEASTNVINELNGEDASIPLPEPVSNVEAGSIALQNVDEEDTTQISEPVLGDEAASVTFEDVVEEDTSVQLSEQILGGIAGSVASEDVVEEDTSTKLSEPVQEAVSIVTDDFVEQDASTTKSSKINLEAQILAVEEQISQDSSQSSDQLESHGVHVDGKEIPIEEIVLASGAAMLPRPDKALTGGEDAYFISDNNWLGIADGVGQWSFEGINAGIYARELMENCRKIVSDGKGSEVVSPKEVLKLGAAKCESPGSSTVLVAYFDSQAQVLHVANIGDSEFLILRNGNIYEKSSPMSHEFNFPFQIQSGDDPSELLETHEVELDEGDIIILATDGLFDNLYDKEIATTVSSSLAAGIDMKGIAELLATRAQEVGKSTSERTPFADAAKAAGYAGYTGGKPDDVSVIVSVVKKESNINHASV